MNMLLAVFLGGGIGSILRHYSILMGKAWLGEGFPYGTLFVNVLGSFIIGIVMEAVAVKWSVPAHVQAFMVTGVLGGFTTFSSFSLDVYKLANTGHPALAAGYVAVSIFVSLLAVFGGAYLVRGVMG
ncbi:MAG: fluoride efflux transporter CrcB [Micavibrio sp.]|nr:fluoride efflux transporter CrcB [Micavibrio sp.]